MMRDKIVTVVLCIILFIVPVLIVPSELANYNILKLIVLLTCGFILLLTTLTRIEKLKFDRADKFIVCFGILAILSTIFSTNVNKSLIGENNRYEGLFSVLTYILVYYNAKYFFKNFKNFTRIGTIIYTLICMFAILQFIVYNGINLYPIFGKGANGTFGNTNFMGSFVSLIIPAFTLGYIFTNRKRYLFCSLIGFTAMIMCIARSALVAFIFSMIMLLIYLIVKRRKTYFKRFFILIIGFVLCYVFINCIDFNKVISSKFNIIQNDIWKFVNNGITDELGAGRIRIWKFSSKLLYKVPILGCGVDAIKDGLYQYFTIEDLVFMLTYNRFIDKAHNEYLQIAVTIGIPALIFYILFIGTICIAGLKKLFKHKVLFLYLLVIFSYLVQAFFNISTIGVAPIFWFALGITSRIGKNKAQNLFVN